MTALQQNLAAALHATGAQTLFGLVGGGNFALAGVFREHGGRYVGLRHEMNAAAAADSYARTTQTVGLVTVTQGPGLTHAMTAIVEAAKSSTPMLVLAADTPLGDRSSNQSIDQRTFATATSAGHERWVRPDDLDEFVRRVTARAIAERRPIIVGFPPEANTDPDSAAKPVPAVAPAVSSPAPPVPADVEAAASLLLKANRPCVLAGRGAHLAGAGPALAEIAQHLGAVLATTAMANGLFSGHPLSAGVCGGFGDADTADLLSTADVVLVVGASLNSWTTRHRSLFHDANVLHVDDRADAIGAHRPADLAIVADAQAFANTLRDNLIGACGPNRSRFRATAEALAAGPDRTFPPVADDGLMDPRALVVALDQILPRERCVTVDGGHFSGWPVMHMSVIDPASLLYPHGFQTIGMGIGSLVGVATARPDRLPVGMVGDGGLLMSLGELDTLLAERIPALVVVFNDLAYGAEMHHFAGRPDSDLALLPEQDFAGIFRAMGGHAGTVRTPADLAAIRPWLAHRAGPMLLDCRISRAVVAPWLASALGTHREPVGGMR
ncbi:thiamine pyrophosphate-dependent acetolactate synthase large subunit-like protein [Kibdelosporangium banguiense]|uniref:Thiamine pyrophosphate-dependent acetolactate synthase large subunit-like protein n=1 Tax=Kibdelosporangium banguiense TaxID=1365924 RepID=A0ABS4U1A0_9PSEU|nr:thiamine pyrophosphate-binding protein [Kibdelosporangium banguiense]MBP2330419.1 thiamine pyrophosphate-dependent acetolactate synthase large subunit-like protein [Kibdelosporangium banguiense]